MKKSLDVWIQNGLPNENRTEAARRILEAFDKNSSQLDLEGLGLQSLPEEIGNLTKLRTLYLYNNQLTQLPESIGNLTKLRTLYLDNNHLLRLPESIGNLTGLSRLWLGPQSTEHPTLALWHTMNKYKEKICQSLLLNKKKNWK